MACSPKVDTIWNLTPISKDSDSFTCFNLVYFIDKKNHPCAMTRHKFRQPKRKRKNTWEGLEGTDLAHDGQSIGHRRGFDVRFCKAWNRQKFDTSGENPKNRPGFDNGNMYHSKNTSKLKNFKFVVQTRICELQFQSHFCRKVVGVQIGWCR